MMDQMQYFSGEHRFDLVPGAGRFLHREQPEHVTRLILDWLEHTKLSQRTIRKSGGPLWVDRTNSRFETPTVCFPRFQRPDCGNATIWKRSRFDFRRQDIAAVIGTMGYRDLETLRLNTDRQGRKIPTVGGAWLFLLLVGGSIAWWIGGLRTRPAGR
jgi:hypothetical protein